MKRKKEKRFRNLKVFIGSFLCMIGLHDWDGHTDTDFYPPPVCKRNWCRQQYRKPKNDSGDGREGVI